MGAIVIGFSSCKKFLDINDNPNNATETTPENVLPQAIVASAAVANNFNITLADIGGQQANAGGFGGFGSVVTYEYTTSSFTDLWASTMQANVDLKYVVDNTMEDPAMGYYTAPARILKALNFARLVDQYDDIPYSEALMGKDNLYPAYDSAEEIYKDLVGELTASIELIEATEAMELDNPTSIIPFDSDFDPLFEADLDLWKRFANTVKLRLLIKMAGVPDLASYATEQFNSLDETIGFLESDALVNPGYSNELGKQAPIFASRGETVTGSSPLTSRVPTYWMLGFYDGNKLTDDLRGLAIYSDFPGGAANQLGDESEDVDKSSGFDWFPDHGVGVVKGAGQAQPIMLAAEGYFLQAEAYARGYLSGDAEAAFNSGIMASYHYLFLDESGNFDDADGTPEEYLTAYQDANTGNYLVNFTEAAGLEEQIEAIITQKYIALNFVNNDEAYNEFRRTGFPAIVNGSSDPYESFASLKSRSTRPDKLVGRILYPAFEYAQNGANAPSGISLFGSTIFWDVD